MSVLAARKAAARAELEARYPAVARVERRPPKPREPATRRPASECPTVLAPEPEPEPETKREPPYLGKPRNGGHRIDLSDNYRGTPDFVDEWDRRSAAFRSGAAYGAVSSAVESRPLEERVTVDLDLAIRIREARESRGFTRRQVAQRLGVKPNWMQELENQRKGVVPRARFERLCKIIDLELETGNQQTEHDNAV